LALPPKTDNRLTPAEVEMILRRAAELGARRRDSVSDARSISPEVLIQVAGALGIAERDIRRALFDLFSDKTAEPHTLAWRLYGPSRFRAVREFERPTETLRTHLENLLKQEQGLKLRRKTVASSLFEAGDLLSTMRRALDFSGHHPLLRARSVELKVEDASYGRSEVALTADLANQRGEYLSLGGILGATLALPLAIAGAHEPLYFLAVVPAFIASGAGFRLAYRKACADVRRVMDELLGTAEESLQEGEGQPEEPRKRLPGQIPRLEPIPKFTTSETEEDV
jgi:hypothetical protein